MISQRGVTFVEVILALGLLLIIFTVSSPSISAIYLNNNFDTTKTMLISTLRKAQTYSVYKKNGSNWGVCLIGGQIRLYTGSCLSPTTQENFSVPSSVSISGLSDFSFSAVTGEPSVPQSITCSGGTKSTNIVINSIGGFSFN